MHDWDLNQFERGRIFGLRFDAHWSCNKIANVLRKPFSTVKKFCQCSGGIDNVDNILSNRVACGRRMCTTLATDNDIDNVSLRNRFISSDTIRRRLNLQCSFRTVINRLLQPGLHARSPEKKQRLTNEHKIWRLIWANRHLNWTVNHTVNHLRGNYWSDVIFSDESPFNVSNPRSQFIRRRSGETYAENCIKEIENRAVAACNVWGDFSEHGFTPLIRILGRLNANRYVAIL
jgi:hypothetical protein